jgi:hypothetical protein
MGYSIAGMILRVRKAVVVWTRRMGDSRSVVRRIWRIEWRKNTWDEKKGYMVRRVVD